LQIKNSFDSWSIADNNEQVVNDDYEDMGVNNLQEVDNPDDISMTTQDNQSMNNGVIFTFNPEIS